MVNNRVALRLQFLKLDHPPPPVNLSYTHIWALFGQSAPKFVACLTCYFFVLSFRSAPVLEV